MKKALLALFGIATAMVLVSCGGGGGGTHVLSQTGRSVQNMQRFTALSMANSGIDSPSFQGYGTGGAAGGTSGGGFGLPSMGGFVRNFGGVTGVGGALKAGRAPKSREGGSTGGSGGTGGGIGGDNPDFYFDEWLELWVQTTVTDSTYEMLFFTDEQKQHPAGHVTSTFPANWDVYPQAYTMDYVFTAGTLTGAHGTYHCTQATEFDGSMTYDDTYSDGSTDQGASTWTQESSAWSCEWHGPNNETWYRDNGTWNADGTSVFSCSNSDGWSSTWTYNADWSGRAHFEGPDPKLPADMTWTADGHYRITYADGTSESWSWQDLWVDGGGGTVGGGVVEPMSTRAKS